MWHQTYSYSFPSFQYVGIRTGGARIGACASETNWSIRGWTQEKRYNSRSLQLVDSLVRMHSNIILEPRLEQLEQFAVSWDLDCSIPEPEPAAEEPERRRSRRLSGEQPNQNDDTEDLTELIAGMRSPGIPGGSREPARARPEPGNPEPGERH